ncbi:DUF3179 domain-containing protein [Winogradskyella sp. A2]|uniref:DUF3179 domain-containing protein n=1 Tax=Winogradskyella sp. A2 TaxID=3366944 RepID=UPI00398C58BC
MKTIKTTYLLLLVLLVFSCSSSDPSNNDSNSDTSDDNDPSPTDSWLIPVGDVKDGGPGKDGIPSIENPMFNLASETTMDDDEIVVGIKIGNTIRAYPHFILDYHEIVNDIIDTENISISYCPLTGTAFAWESAIEGNIESHFGVSGLLYNSNLILYDRETDSYWSQMRLQCVNGDLIGDFPEIFPVIETNWNTWKNMYPNSEVLNTQTGFDKPYGNYPYGDYRTDQDLFLFVPSPLNPALPNKERVFTIIDDDKAKVYKFSNFINGNVIIDNFNGKDYLVIGNENIINAFEVNGIFNQLEYTFSFVNSDVFFTDNEGNGWSIFGEVISGPRLGQTLNSPTSVTSMWFATAAFYPNPQIYSE